MTAAYPRIIAHRGGGALAAENTLAGIDAAAALGCRGVEFDVRLSADGVPVLMHDATVERTTGGRGVVSALTIAELHALDAGGEPVPRLDEALERCHRLGLWTNIELKADAGREAETGHIVARLLAARWDGHGVVSSFAGEALAACRREAAALPLALLCVRPPADWRERADALGAVGLHCAARHAAAATLAAIAAAGLAAACYTVNSRRTGDALLGCGAAIFTDRPDRWRPGEM